MTAYVERGAEIPRGTWEYEWVSSVVAEVAAYGDRPSHWNGELYEQAGPVAGRYHRDGCMTISRAHVLDPARPAYTPGHQLTSDEAFAAAGATQMAVFQARLSLSELGTTACQGQPSWVPGGPGSRAGAGRPVHPAYGGRIAEKLTDQSLPMLSGAPAYPAYTTATDRLLRPLAAATGTGLERLRDLVERTERTQRFTVIADRALDHQLGDLVPDAHRAELREHLSAPLRRGLGGLATIEYSRLHPGSKLTLGDQSAERTAAEFDANLDEVTTHYTSWNDRTPGRAAAAAAAARTRAAA